MASAFGHAALGATLGKLILPDRGHWPYWVVAAVCAALPDLDALGYRFGVPYDSLWGHRGLTHSLLAAAVVGVGGAAFARLVRPARRPPGGRLSVLLFLATASHGLLDAMTTGGLGVAFFSPWDLERFFLAFAPFGFRRWGSRLFLEPAAYWCWPVRPCGWACRACWRWAGSACATKAELLWPNAARG